MSVGNREQRNVEIEKTNVERKMDSGMVAATFIKYAAYVAIFFGALWFWPNMCFRCSVDGGRKAV